MKPHNLKTKIFLDGGDPWETREVVSVLGFLDGQTTNPTLIAKHPEAKKRMEQGKKFSTKEIFDFYKQVVGKISKEIPNGSVSVEVYADKNTSADAMFAQGKEMFSWIPNAHIKYPITTQGLAAAEKSIQEGMRVNMTLCFNQEQAAAVYAATRGAHKGGVFVSPFIGRLDDRGENGMDLIRNILAMYEHGDGHVEALAASVRNMGHFMKSLAMGADIITAPLSVLSEWGKAGMPMPQEGAVYDASGLQRILYQEKNLNNAWTEFDITHELTDKGIERFSSDWNALIA